MDIFLPDLLTALLVRGDMKIRADPPGMRCAWRDWR
jgi:hypothetical protein